MSAVINVTDKFLKRQLKMNSEKEQFWHREQDRILFIINGSRIQQPMNNFLFVTNSNHLRCFLDIKHFVRSHKLSFTTL